MDDWLEIILKALPRIGWVGGILVSVLFVQADSRPCFTRYKMCTLRFCVFVCFLPHGQIDWHRFRH